MSTNKNLVPEAKGALDKFKMEAARSTRTTSRIPVDKQSEFPNYKIGSLTAAQNSSHGVV